MTSARRAAAWVERLAHRSRWYGRIAAGTARRAARVSLAGAGLPIRKECLIFECMAGEDASGLFSEVAAAIGCLAEVEAHPELYAGVRIDFADRGLYYEPARGLNWWEYFFEPVTIGGGGRDRRVPDWEHDAFAETVELTIPRAEAAALVRRHVRVRRALLDQADGFWRAHASRSPIVGLHFRGTDKSEEATRVPWTPLVAAIEARGAAAGADWRLLVATDEEACVAEMRAAFPGRVIARDIVRSADGKPMHKQPGNAYQGGADAVVDCVLLSRCAHLVRTPSNLGLVSTFFNPEVPVTLVSR